MRLSRYVWPPKAPEATSPWRLHQPVVGPWHYSAITLFLDTHILFNFSKVEPQPLLSHITHMQVFIKFTNNSGNIKYERWCQFINGIVIIAVAIWWKGEFLVWYKIITLVGTRFIVLTIELDLLLPLGALQCTWNFHATNIMIRSLAWAFVRSISQVWKSTLEWRCWKINLYFNIFKGNQKLKTWSSQVGAVCKCFSWFGWGWRIQI